MKAFFKKHRFVLIVSLIIFFTIALVSILAYSYAFFYFGPKEQPLLIQVSSVTDFAFSIDKNFNLTVNPNDLYAESNNVSDTSVATVSLRAPSFNNHSEKNYYVYFRITSNSFTRTDVNSPEIILSVTDPLGNEVTNISGLSRVSYNNITGFDISEVTGTFNIGGMQTIISNSSEISTTQSWTFTITYINLESDQSGNDGHSMNPTIILSKTAL